MPPNLVGANCFKPTLKGEQVISPHLPPPGLVNPKNLHNSTQSGQLAGEGLKHICSPRPQQLNRGVNGLSLAFYRRAIGTAKPLARATVSDNALRHFYLLANKQNRRIVGTECVSSGGHITGGRAVVYKYLGGAPPRRQGGGTDLEGGLPLTHQRHHRPKIY